MIEKDKKPNKNKWFLWLILVSLFTKLFYCVFKKEKEIECNLKEFIKEEEKEVEELRTHKESFKKFFGDSTSIFQDYFIPSHDNDHKPKILRPRSLVIITVLTLLLKFSVTGYLFFIYPNQAKMTEAITTKVLELTNADRAGQNLPALTLNSVLSASAEAKAQDMIMNDYFAHHSPTGKKPWDWISRGDYAYIFVGENLAMNFTSATAVHNALMQSPSHKKNIMNEKYQDIGLAMVSGEINGQETNVLVEFFGARSTVKLTSAVPAEIKPAVVEVAVKETVTPTPVSVLGEKEEVKPVETVKPAETIKPLETVKPVEIKPAKTEPKPVTPKPSIEPAKPVSVPNAPAVATSMKEDLVVEKIARADSDLPLPLLSSPNPEIENNITPTVTYIEPTDSREFRIAATLVKGSNYIYLAVLVFMVISLAINILVRITVQHKPVIIQTLLVIVLIGGLYSVHIHFLENMVDKIAIL